MHICIVAMDQKLHEGEADMIVLPGSAGDLGILDNHAPLLTSLRPGTIQLYQKQVLVHEFPIEEGFARISPTACQVYLL